MTARQHKKETCPSRVPSPKFRSDATSYSTGSYPCPYPCSPCPHPYSCRRHPCPCHCSCSCSYYNSSCTRSHAPSPLTHTTVALPSSIPSGKTHFTCCTFGHGHSAGAATHVSVFGHRYCEHDTGTGIKHICTSTWSEENVPASACAIH